MPYLGMLIFKEGKTLSAGILIQDTITKKLLACKTTDWPTSDCYDVPKGNVDSGETPIQAAVRELWEETGIKLTQEEIKSLIPLGTLHFIPTLGTLDREKDIKLFYLQKEVSSLLPKMRCHSFYTDSEGNRKPEISGYALIPENNLSLFYRAFQPLMKKFLQMRQKV